MKNLMSMTDFVLNKDSTCIFKYAKFLKQPLEKWMFVPCKLVDGIWVVLEEPNVNNYHHNAVCSQMYCDDKKEYKKAKERCLFEGFELKGQTDLSWIFKYNNKFPYFVNKSGNIESIVKYNLQITPTAQKQIGL